MNTPCASPIAETTLAAYWLCEMDSSDSQAIEEHLFACGHCSARLQRLANLGAGIRQAVEKGASHAVLSAAFVRKLKDAGLRVREYPVQPGTSVACTIEPEDDLVVSRLYAPLVDVHRLDLVFEHPAAGTRHRLEDLAFDRNADEIVVASNTPFVRSLGSTTLHMRLLAVQPDGERELGLYTFNHSPYAR